MRDDILDGVLDHCAGMELTDEEDVAKVAIDKTLHHVVEFLAQFGGTDDARDIIILDYELQFEDF